MDKFPKIAIFWTYTTLFQYPTYTGHQSSPTILQWDDDDMINLSRGQSTDPASSLSMLDTASSLKFPMGSFHLSYYTLETILHALVLPLTPLRKHRCSTTLPSKNTDDDTSLSCKGAAPPDAYFPLWANAESKRQLPEPYSTTPRFLFITSRRT